MKPPGDIRSIRRARPFRIPALGLTICIAVCAVLPAFASAPQISVEVMPAGASAYRVSVLYPSTVDRKRGQAEAADLWRRAGWTPTSVLWSTTPALKRFPAQTTVEFTVNTLYPKGVFPVDAFAMAYRSWGGVALNVSPAGSFQYRGPAHFEDKDAQVDVMAHGNALAVSVHVKNPRMKGLNLAPVQPAGAPPIPRRKSQPVFALVCLALGAAGAAWLAVYAFLVAGRQQPEPAKPAPKTTDL